MPTNPPAPATMPVYRLAEGYMKNRDGEPVHSWPYLVSYVPECSQGVFLMEEGDGRNGNGGFFEAAQIIQPIWHSHFEAASALWLLPLLERMAAGTPVTEPDIFEAYKAEHGDYPPRDEMRRF